MAELATSSRAAGPRATPDWGAVRQRFPACASLCYLDSARKATLPDHVGQVFSAWLDDVNSTAGGRAFSLASVEEARSQLARTYGAPAAGLAFVKNTSEGINAVAQGYARLKAGDNVLVSAEEHESNIFPWRRLEQRGIEVRFLAADAQGQVAIDAVRATADAHTRVIAVSWVTYGRGVRLDLALLGQFAAERQILLVVDAIQGLGILDSRIDQLGAHVVAAGGHKGLFGLNGTGLLYVDPEVIGLIEPPYAGKYSFTSNERFQPVPAFATDAHRFEYGNPNYSGLAILKHSAAFIEQLGLAAIEARVEELTDLLIDHADRLGLALRTPRAWRQRASIVSFETRGNAAEILSALRDRGIVMSEKDGHLRASVHVYNSEEEIAHAASTLAELGLGGR